eukprot:11191232-Lingulodinium_polyedra.AAC.1
MALASASRAGANGARLHEVQCAGEESGRWHDTGSSPPPQVSIGHIMVGPPRSGVAEQRAGTRPR